MAPYGLGAELRPLVEERARVLRSFGIEASDPNRVPKLRELARHAVGERAAVAQGLTFLSRPPDDFRGRVVPLADAPAYVGVTDGERLVVLPATRDVREHLGRAVTLARDASGKRLRVVPHELDRGR